METVSTTLSHGGVQGVYKHASTATDTEMTFSVFVPPQADGTRLPVVWYLSGLTCTHANVTEKGEFREVCARLGLVLVAPDTSPRGEAVPDDPTGAYDFGLGAGFFVDATEEPFASNYRMWTYVTAELPALVESSFPVDLTRQAIMGHSMGGHGALTIGLRHPDRFRSVSAFSPIVAPSQVPWGQKAFEGYLGADRAAWRKHDAVALIGDGARIRDILIIERRCTNPVNLGQTPQSDPETEAAAEEIEHVAGAAVGEGVADVVWGAFIDPHLDVFDAPAERLVIRGRADRLSAGHHDQGGA
jgi:S-formylglutathione hydrolase